MCPGALCVYFLVSSKWFKDETGPEEEQKSGRETTGRAKTCLTSHVRRNDGFPLTSPEASWWHHPKSRSDFSHWEISRDLSLHIPQLGNCDQRVPPSRAGWR